MRDIWEEVRAALCIAGGSRRLSPSLPPPDLVGGGIEEQEEDRLSALPDDVLLFILGWLPSAAAARTSVLSRRWRHLWGQVRVLFFPPPAEPALALPSPAPAARTRVRSHRWRRLFAHLPARRTPAQPAGALPIEPARAMPSPASARAALAQHSAPALLSLGIIAKDADPGDMTAVLRLATLRLTGLLFFGNVAPVDQRNAEMAEAVMRDAIELPCFDRAEWITLYLGDLCLSLPPSGVFRKLTVLFLSDVRFQSAFDIGDTFSSARCPSLRDLRLFNAQGVSNLSICSESLIHISLNILKGLQQLTIVSPMLRYLSVSNCFYKRQPVADITAPVLENLIWLDEYDPRSVQLGKLAQLRVLSTSSFAYTWYGLPEHQYNLGTIMLLQCFMKIPVLLIVINYPTKMVYCQNWMETLTSLPVEILDLVLVPCGHAIGSCVFHFLKISTCTRCLLLSIREDIKEQAACSPDCVCHQLHDWESEEILLNSLQELKVCGLRGAGSDLTFVKRLLGWARMLKSVTIDFYPKATVDEDVCEELLGLSGPETCMKIYLYRDGAKVMYTPVG